MITITIITTAIAIANTNLIESLVVAVAILVE